MAEPFRLCVFLLLGVVASLLLALGLLIMKSRGEALPAAQGAQVLSAVLGWIHDSRWLGGLGVEVLGYALYMVALAGAPVSLLAVTMQGGIALFIIFAAVFLGERADVREWLGIVGIVVAMILLALSLQTGAAEGAIDGAALVLLSAGAIVVAALPSSTTQLRVSGAAPAIASGVAFGLGSLYGKALTDALAAAPKLATALFTTPWLSLTIVANLVGLVLLQNSFHWTRGIIAMPLSSACSNIVPIIGGMVAFGEHLPADRFSAAMRLSAFALTIISSALLAFATDETRT
jgi:drug/metabolite transporter (DMT)-like permease